MKKACFAVCLTLLFFACKKDKAIEPGVIICSQVWMPQNLDVTAYRNGDTIPHITDYVEWVTATQGAWCTFNNVPGGTKLYNWYAIRDPRGIAPEGWHVASAGEWGVLNEYVGKYGPLVNDNFLNALEYYGMKNFCDSIRDASPYNEPESGFVRQNYFNAWANDTIPTAVTGYIDRPFVEVVGVSFKENGFSVRCVKDK